MFSFLPDYEQETNFSLYLLVLGRFQNHMTQTKFSKKLYPVDMPRSLNIYLNHNFHPIA